VGADIEDDGAAGRGQQRHDRTHFFDDVRAQALGLQELADELGAADLLECP
jgi:hypothetical protein